MAIKSQMSKQNGYNSGQSSREALLKAKIAFLEASDAASPMGIVHRRPFSSLGCAFLLGFFLNAVVPSRKTTSTLASVAEIAGVLSRILPYIRASNSGG